MACVPKRTICSMDKNASVACRRNKIIGRIINKKKKTGVFSPPTGSSYFHHCSPHSISLCLTLVDAGRALKCSKLVMFVFNNAAIWDWRFEVSALSRLLGHNAMWTSLTVDLRLRQSRILGPFMLTHIGLYGLFQVLRDSLSLVLLYLYFPWYQPL